nr:MAG TPA: hypothetical protein [Caudoviricetes sp.]
MSQSPTAILSISNKADQGGLLPAPRYSKKRGNTMREDTEDVENITVYFYTRANF